MPKRQVVRTWSILGAPCPSVWTDEVDEANEGEFSSAHGEARVSRDTPAMGFWPVESHELGHSVFHKTGLTRRIRDHFGLSPEVAAKIEEEIVATFLPVYLDMLQRAGCLSPPSAPVMEDES